MHKIFYFIAASFFMALSYIIVYRGYQSSQVHVPINEDAQARIEKILNTKAEFFSDEGVIKVNFPRKDIKVTIATWPLDPFMGLTSWIGFQSGAKKDVEIMAMGDLVLLEDEVPIAMSIALENDIQITALHNHFFYDTPKVYFMHVEAEGTIEAIAQGIYKTLDAIKMGRPKVSKPLPTMHAISKEPLEKIISAKGTAKDGMFKIVIGRQTQAGCGCTVGKNMGVNTWAAFGGTDDNAIVDGDFAVLESEVQRVLKALILANINIVAIHNHMINENPRMIFLHFWGQGKAADLAQGIKNALEKTTTMEIL